MKIFPAQFRLFWALIFFFIFLTSVFAIPVSLMIHYQVSRFFENAQNDMDEHQTHHIIQTVQTFLEDRLLVLEDHARLPLITTGVMRPDLMPANLVDLMGGLTMLGSKGQLVLLDYQGRDICHSEDKPGFDYTGELWFHQIMRGKIDSYIGVSSKDDSRYWRLAVPVLYRDNPEGVLVSEINVDEFQLLGKMAGVMEDFHAELVSQGHVIASLGAPLHGDYREISIRGLNLVLRYQPDWSTVHQARDSLILEILGGMVAIILLVLLLALFMSEILYVSPLKQLRRLVHRSTTDKSADYIPSNQRLLEISALAKDFNSMIEQRKNREDELLAARTELEHRVQERTRELELSRHVLHEINVNLERTVSERTQELDFAHTQMVTQDKLASVGRLAAGVAHELNNPINFVRTNFATLEDNFSDLLELLHGYQGMMGEIEKNVLRPETSGEIKMLEEKLNISFIIEDIPVLFDESEQGFEQIAGIIQSMRDFSRAEQGGVRSWANLNKGIEDTLRLARNEYKYCAEIETNLGDINEIYCSLEQINQVFLNLIVNSAQAIAEMNAEKAGLITISTWQDEENIYCEFKDNGPGVPEKLRKHIFDPFFTTKPPGQGTGLGLSISYDIIVRKHQGSLSMSCPEDGGSVFTISLPLELPEEAQHDTH